MATVYYIDQKFPMNVKQTSAEILALLLARQSQYSEKAETDLTSFIKLDQKVIARSEEPEYRAVYVNREYITKFSD